MTSDRIEASLEEVKTTNPPVVHHPNWIPPELRVPEDEFCDLNQIELLHTVEIDESLCIQTVCEGKGSLPEPGDTIYYKHSTRFDNGQLCNFDERRRVVDLLIVDNPRYHQYLNICFKQMRRGQTAWIRVGENWHKGGYHLKKFLQKPYMK